jgi:heat shock protein HtpX
MQNAEPVLVYDRIEANRRSTVLLLGLFALISLPAAAYVAQYLAFVVTIFVSPATGDDWVTALIAGAIIAVAIVVAAAYLQYRYASAAVLRFAGGREVKRDEEPDLWRTVENLCIGAGLPQPRVYVMESVAANAFATGFSPEHASLVVTRGLLELLNRRELEGVIAHELSQIGNYDTRLSAIVAAGVGTLRLPFVVVVGVFRFLFRLHWIVGAGVLLYFGLPLLFGVAFSIALLSEEPGIALLVLLALALLAYVLLGAPLLGLLLRRAISRQREFLADADAVLLTRHAEGLATALAKMATAGGSRMKVGGATAHLYVVDPLREDAPWWDRIFPTHPPVEERIAALAGMGGGISPSVLREASEAGAKFTPTATAATVVATPRWEERALADEATESAEAAPPAEPRRASGGFRLTGEGTTLYAKPDTASAALRQLPGGALITVIERQGDFVRVLTAGDRFGYISSSASMTPVEVP